MKLSIWQQFSSNHSNDFTIVGVFKNLSQANAGKQEIEKLLDKMKKANGDEEVAKIVSKFGVSWTHTSFPDWLVVGIIEIIQHHDVLFLTVGNNWSSQHPLDLIIHKLSGNSAFNSETGGWITWTFTFEIIDTAKADTLEMMVLELTTMDLEQQMKLDWDNYPTGMMNIVWHDSKGGILPNFTRNGIHFEISNADLIYSDELTFPHVIKWLRESGASNIRYRVTQD